jgi:hypothetical protein
MQHGPVPLRAAEFASGRSIAGGGTCNADPVRLTKHCDLESGHLRGIADALPNCILIDTSRNLPRRSN